MDNHYIYFMETDKYIKIGITKNIHSRIKQVQTGCPTKIHTVHFSIAKNRETALKTEKELHSTLSDYNTFGEWFYHIKSNLYKKSKRILDKNSCSKVEVLFKIENREEDISENLSKKIETISLSDSTFSEKISELSKLYIKIKDKNTTFIALTRAFVLKKCIIEIKIQKNFIRKEEELIEEEARGQAHIEFAEIVKKSDIEFEKRKKELTPTILKSEKKQLKYKGLLFDKFKTDTLKDAERSLSKCRCEKHLKIIDDIENLYPHLRKECNVRRTKIKIKVEKAFSKIPSSAKDYK